MIFQCRELRLTQRSALANRLSLYQPSYIPVLANRLPFFEPRVPQKDILEKIHMCRSHPVYDNKLPVPCCYEETGILHIFSKLEYYWTAPRSSNVRQGAATDSHP